MAQFSATYTNTLALYCALQIARKHATAIRFSTHNLRTCLEKSRGDRLSRLQLRAFAERFKPIFDHHFIDEDHNGNISLVLYFSQKDDPAPANSIVPGACVSQEGINKALGIESI